MLMVQVGDVVAHEPARGILGPPLEASQWYILTVMSQREAGTSAKLARLGLPETWYPTETAWRPQRGRRAKVAYERLIAPGYVFLETQHELRWHRLFDVTRGFVTGVVGDEVPRVIPEQVIAQMQHVPERIQLLREEETAKEKAERLLRLPREGQGARLTSGPFVGMIVQVHLIDRGIARFVLDGIKGEAPVEKLERVRGSEALGSKRTK